MNDLSQSIATASSDRPTCFANLTLIFGSDELQSATLIFARQLLLQHNHMDQRIPSQIGEFQLEQMDGEILLYNPSNTKTIYLNQTSSLIWGLCDGERTIAAIVSLLEESYPDSKPSIADDVAAALHDFATHGAIEYK